MNITGGNNGIVPDQLKTEIKTMPEDDSNNKDSKRKYGYAGSVSALK